MYTIYRLFGDKIQKDPRTDEKAILDYFIREHIKELTPKLPSLISDRQQMDISDVEKNCKLYFGISDEKYANIHTIYGTNMAYNIFELEAVQYKNAGPMDQHKMISQYLTLRAYKNTQRPNSSEYTVAETGTSQLHIMLRKDSPFSYLSDYLKFMYSLDELRSFDDF